MTTQSRSALKRYSGRMGTLAATTALAITTLAPSASVLAADGWLSRATTIDSRGRAKVSVPTHWQKDDTPTIAQRAESSTRTVFDITVSLHNDPAGDDDPMTDSGEAQEVYESIIRHFADSVCEQTNGSHRLGKVRLFTASNQQAAADVIWLPTMAPQAHLSGFGASSRHIYFGDVFPGGAGGSDFNMLNNPAVAGHTLGHEWGHYTYGLFDEYVGNDPLETRPNKPQSSDIGTVPSIMNGQWRAVGGDFDWLNHSTANNIGITARTAQGRVYGKSAWEVLTQSQAADPKSGNRKAQPDRTQYVSLLQTAPTAADDWVRLELPADQSSCRGDLDIIWVDGDINLQIVLDRSGSMIGTPINNAKQAASVLVDTTADGQTGLGVASFAGDLRQNAPLQPIPDPGSAVKNQIKAIINNLSAGGATRLYDGALAALNELAVYQSNNATTAPEVVFLLSDGRDTSSFATENDVITAFQTANVPLFTFGFGDASPTGSLLRLANATGGLYTFSPTDLSQITQAFLQANAIASDLSIIVDTQQSVIPGTLASVAMPVDAGLDSLSLVVNYNGNVSDVDIEILDPAGDAVSDVDFECLQIGGALASCSGQLGSGTIAARGSGVWQIGLRNESAADREINLYAAGLPGENGSFSARVAGAQGNEIIYPSPIVLTASVVNDFAVTDINIVAQITDPVGAAQSFAMTDDGTGGDAQSGDGIYSAILGYDTNGTYGIEVRIDNANGTARYTTSGLQPAHYAGTVDGSLPAQQPLPTINEDFSRISRTSIVVTGRPTSDTNNGFLTAEEMFADNNGRGGIIDVSGDVDYYAIRNVDPTVPLLVRVTDLSLGMEPVLTVYAEDTITELVSPSTLPVNASDAGYLYVQVPVGQLTDTVYAVVSHANPSAGTGSFNVSAGMEINTDTPPNAIPVTGTDIVTLIEGSDAQISVLSNDTDSDGDILTIEDVGASPNGATVSLGASNTVTYATTDRPFALPPGATLTETVLYTVTDGKAYRSGQVQVSVSGNTPPSAAPDTASTDANSAVVIAVLGNDSDADGQTLTLTGIDATQTDGMVSDNGNGTVTYDPAGAFDSLTQSQTGTTSFQYNVTDEGGLTSSAEATVTVLGITPVNPPTSGGGGGALNILVLLVLTSQQLVRRRK